MLKVICGALVVAACLATTASAASAPPVTFADPAGDSAGGPDIIGVEATNDASGTYTFEVLFASTYADNGELWLYLDTDDNANDNDVDYSGADYLVYDDHASHSADLYKWDATDGWVASGATAPEILIASDSKSVTITFNKDDVGGSTKLHFFAATDDSTVDGSIDDAPSGNGTFTYSLQQVKVSLTSVVAKSAYSKGAHTWVLALIARRSDTGAYLGSEGTIACSAKAGTKKLKPAAAVFVTPQGSTTSVAECAFKIPNQHLKLTGSVTVTYGGGSLTKTFTAKT